MTAGIILTQEKLEGVSETGQEISKHVLPLKTPTQVDFTFQLFSFCTDQTNQMKHVDKRALVFMLT